MFNLNCLAQTLLPRLDNDPDTSAQVAMRKSEQHNAIFISFYAQNIWHKLSLFTQHTEDQVLLQNLLDLLQADRVDYTIFFRRYMILFMTIQNTISRFVIYLFSVTHGPKSVRHVWKTKYMPGCLLHWAEKISVSCFS